MVDVIKSLGHRVLRRQSRLQFRGLHESLINYGNNTSSGDSSPACHEESSVAMAHGYAKIEGKPMMIMAHGTVGLQHASMAIYNAYATACRSTSCWAICSTSTTGAAAPSGYHSVQDAAAMVRDYTKWDDTPVSLSHFAESAVRAYKIAMTPPTSRCCIVADGALQEEPITEKNLRIPKLVMTAPPQGDSGAVDGSRANCWWRPRIR